MQRATKRAKSDASVAFVFQRTYAIDIEALRSFLKTRDANVIVPLVQNHPNTLRSREIVERLLGTVNANGCCHAQYKYSSKYNECELYKYGLSHSRVYAVDKYSCAFACLPQKNQKLRSLALNRDYYAFDLSKCYHYIGLGLTQNEETRKVLQYFVDKADEIMNDVATFYGVDLKTTKEWFHAFSNNKQIANWQRENDIDTTHEFIVTWVATQNNVTSEMCALYPTAHERWGDKPRRYGHTLIKTRRLKRGRLWRDFSTSVTSARQCTTGFPCGNTRWVNRLMRRRSGFRRS